MEKFITMPYGEDRVEIAGIPFAVKKENENIVPIANEGKPINFKEERCSHVVFAGMVTREAPCSEWWGPDEYWHNNSVRLFLGDSLGFIRIVYDDDTLDCVELIYGVTVWSYELITERKPHEMHLNNFEGPYPEPFRSDAAARKLLDRSLRLVHDPKGDKGSSYLLAVRLREDKPVKSIYLIESGKTNKVFVSGITFVKAGSGVTFEKEVCSDWFLKKGYLPDVDKLARRLYQFRDEIPEHVESLYPADYSGSKAEFGGSNVADIWTNLYLCNIEDITRRKIDSEGVPHTSSQGAPEFGLVIGNGMFRENVGLFYPTCWTRDVGRVAIEAAYSGRPCNLTDYVNVIETYLYDDTNQYYKAQWKRVGNGRQLGWDQRDYDTLKENDGHASMMMSVYAAYRHGSIDVEWVRSHEKFLADAAGWYRWQIDHPELSGFRVLLANESESSTQMFAISDLFSNVMSMYSLEAYAIMASDAGLKTLEKECRDMADLLRRGVDELFLSDSRYGQVYHDITYDCWTYDYKRFAHAFVYADIYGYDLSGMGEELLGRIRNSYREQKDRFFNPYSGRQMGYGQGYLTNTALLLDEVEDYTACIEACAFLSYHHTDYNYIVPEGVIVHPSGRFWFRNGDQGNAVQQGEIMKSGRLMLGLDQLGDGLRVIPRLPETFDHLSLYNTLLTVIQDGKPHSIKLKEYTYRRLKRGYVVKLRLDAPVEVSSIRFGPFRLEDEAFDVPAPYSVRTIAGHKYVYVQNVGRVKSLTMHCRAVKSPKID